MDIKVDVLLIGFLVRDDDGNVISKLTSSTSTLIRTPDRNIVVDTGNRSMAEGIRTSFKQIGIFRDEVDTVILTHKHSDHIGNLRMFPKAEVMIHEGELPFEGATVMRGGAVDICPGVRVVHAPGHSPGSCIVTVKSDRTYVIAGDVCPTKDNFVKNIIPRLNTDPDAAQRSLDMVREVADVVIPGHGRPFFTKKAGGTPGKHMRSLSYGVGCFPTY